MKHAQFLRSAVPGRKRRKDGKPPSPLRGGKPFILENFPTARIARMRADRPRFVSNREGWLRFYHWQDWHHRRLALEIHLGEIRRDSRAV